MLKKILVPLDGSPLAEKAIGYAAELSIPTGATILLVRVANSHTLPGVDPRERKEGAIFEAEQYLTQTAATLIERGYACEAAVPFGQPAECIAEQARLNGSSLIVMSSHGRTGAARLLFGSVAEAVVARSSIPVLLTRAWTSQDARWRMPERPLLVVPLDGSPFAETALEPAVSLADDFDAGLLLVRAEPVGARLSDALEYLTRISARLEEAYPDLTVIVDVRSGEPAEAIEAALRQNGAALVVMATHGRGGLVRSIMGSVAGRVLRDGSAPMVLIRPAMDIGSADQPTEQLVGAS